MSGSLWNHVLEQLKTTMNPQTFDAWFSGSSLISSSKERLIIEFQDKRVKDHVESKYLEQISQIIYDLSGRQVKIDFITPNSVEEEKANPNNHYPKDFSINKKGVVNLSKPKINERFDFSHFVVGSNNENAHSVAWSVAENPGSQYNPLFIWGDAGLGKTHLLQAICNKILREKPYLKIIYVHSEQFLNEIQAAFLQGDTSQFKLKYRHADVLLLDDIQFIQDKAKTQIEFFHTFNTLYESGKQIVISSDRPPKHLEYLTDRMRTRFEWGIITKIFPPDLETRVAILKRKASERKLILDDEIFYLIAKNITTHIRALEGALSTLASSKKPITKELSMQLLADYITSEEKSEALPIDEIKKKIAEYFSVSADDIVSKSRSAKLILPRFVAIYFASKFTNLTSKEIGVHFGGRDHSTIINARQEIEKKIVQDSDLKAKILELEQKFSL